MGALLAGPPGGMLLADPDIGGALLAGPPGGMLLYPGG